MTQIATSPLDICARCHHPRHMHTKKNGGCRKGRGRCTCPTFVEKTAGASDVLVDRSWALGAVLAHIQRDELRRVAKLLDDSEVERFLGVMEGYQADMMIRDGVLLS